MNQEKRSGQRIRSILLEVVDEYNAKGPGYFQSSAVLT